MQQMASHAIPPTMGCQSVSAGLYYQVLRMGYVNGYVCGLGGTICTIGVNRVIGSLGLVFINYPIYNDPAYRHATLEALATV